jgi:hypothetical protein
MHARARARHFLRLRGAHGRRPTDRSICQRARDAESRIVWATPLARCSVLRPSTIYSTHAVRVPTVCRTHNPSHAVGPAPQAAAPFHSVADHTPDAAAHFQLYNVPRCPSPLGRAGGHSECPQSRPFTPVPACMPCACMPYVPACPLPATVLRAHTSARVRSPPPARPRPTRRYEGEAVHFGWNSYSRV